MISYWLHGPALVPVEGLPRGVTTRTLGLLGVLLEAALRRPSAGRKRAEAKQHDHGVSANMTTGCQHPSPLFWTPPLGGHLAGRRRSCCPGLADRPQPGAFASTNQRVWLSPSPQFAELAAPAHAKGHLVTTPQEPAYERSPNLRGSTRDAKRERERERGADGAPSFV